MPSNISTSAAQSNRKIINTAPTGGDPLMPIRSWLFVPGTRLELVPKALAKGADAVIIDIEDSVAAAEKASVRQALLAYFDICHQQGAKEDQERLSTQRLWLRINPAHSLDFGHDLDLCQQLPSLAGVVLAKAQSKADIDSCYNGAGLPVIAQIESAKGLYQLDHLCQAEGLVAFSYGILDICHDLNVQVGTPAADIIANQIRYQLLVASKVYDLWPPIDSIYPDFNDNAGLQKRVETWSALGMSGMLCIHPNQIDIVNQACEPTEAQINFAKKVVAEHERSGQAVFQVDGMMVDAPVIERCRQLLARLIDE